MSKAAAPAPRRKPQSFTGKDLDLLRETLGIPHESRTLVFEYLAHTVGVPLCIPGLALILLMRDVLLSRTLAS